MGKQTPKLYRSGLSKVVWCATRWKDLGEGRFEAIEKHDVTDDFFDLAELIVDEWAASRVQQFDGSPADA